MDASVDYYDVLGVPPTATRTEIKASWSELVQKLHPDMGGDAKLFMEVQKAFNVLGDEEQRAQYDELRELTSTSSNPEDVSSAPGWGEEQTTEAGKASAGSAKRKPRRQPYVPPHLRDEEPEPEPEPRVKPQTGPGREEVRTPSEPHRAWRLGLEDDPIVTYWPNPKVQWGVPLVATALALVLWPVTAAVGDGSVLSRVYPILVGVCMLITVVGVSTSWAKTRRGLPSKAGTATAFVMGAIGIVVAIFAPGGLRFAGLLEMVALIIGASLFTRALNYKYVETRSLPLSTVKKFNTFGMPAAAAGSTTESLVQVHTKDRIEKLADIASLRVFHTVGAPVTKSEIEENAFVRSKYGVPVLPGHRIEHVLTAGNRMALVVSAVWPPGVYTVDQYGYIRIDDQPTGQSLAELTESLNHWKAALGKGVDVKAFVAIYPDGPARSEIKSDITAVLADDLEDTVGDWLLLEQEKVNRTLCSKVAEHLLA